jgi:hypothetical protein
LNFFLVRAIIKNTILNILTRVLVHEKMSIKEEKIYFGSWFQRSMVTWPYDFGPVARQCIMARRGEWQRKLLNS